MDFPMVKVTAVDHRFWLDFLRIYMSVVSRDGVFFYHHDDVGSRLEPGHPFVSYTTVVTRVS